MAPLTNLLSIDVEDYFQVSAFEKVSTTESWDNRELRVVKNTDRILSLLDSHNIRATFFILGWVAGRCPELVKNIAAAGHEIASHGYGHQRVGNLSRVEFRDDIRRSKNLLEEITAKTVLGFRAPSYSISCQTFWAFDELLAAGYRYDSSVFPIRHDFYGIPNWPRFASYAIKIADNCWQSNGDQGEGASLLEVPITTLRLFGKNLPIAGGGYFRLFPYPITRWGLQRINQKENQPFVFYLHPWEFDPDQPRIENAPWKSRIRHYLNLRKTEKRFCCLLRDFKFKPIAEGIGL